MTLGHLSLSTTSTSAPTRDLVVVNWVWDHGTGSDGAMVLSPTLAVLEELIQSILILRTWRPKSSVMWLSFAARSLTSESRRSSGNTLCGMESSTPIELGRWMAWMVGVFTEGVREILYDWAACCIILFAHFFRSDGQLSTRRCIITREDIIRLHWKIIHYSYWMHCRGCGRHQCVD